MLVRNLSGVLVDYDNAVMYMDDELRVVLHDQIAPCTEQEFFTAYEQEYLANTGEFWELSKSNPQF